MELQRQPRPGVVDNLILLFEGTRGLLLTLLLVPALLFLVLWLPPVSLGERVLDAGYLPIPSTGGSVTDPDGAQLTLPADALRGPVRLQFLSASRQAFIEGTAGGVLEGAPEALPQQLLIIKSPVYVAAARGSAPLFSVWSLPIPNDSEPYSLLDVYSWDGTRWGWMPHQIMLDSETIEGVAPALPQAVAIMQAQSAPAQVGALTGENPDFVPESGAALTYLSPRLYLVQGDGSIGQMFTPSPVLLQSGVRLVPVLHNLDPSGVIRSDLVDNLLIDPNVWRSHIDQIEALVIGSGYDGIVIDYRNVDPALRNEFSRFVSSLGERLRERNKVLTVRVDEPVRVGRDSFDTGAYDWQAIGRAATTVHLPVPRNAEGRVTEEELRSLLWFATGRVNRYQLELEVGAAPYQVVEGNARPVPFEQVVTALRALAETEGLDVDADAPVDSLVEALVEAGAMALDGETEPYEVELNGARVVVESRDSVRWMLDIINDYHLGGVLIGNGNEADPTIWELVASYRRNMELPPDEPAP